MKRFFLLFSLFFLMAQLSWATTYTWTGNSSTNWATSANWSPSTGYPSSTSDIAQFNSGATITVNLTSSYTTGQLIISNNTNLTLTGSSSTRTLTVGNSSATGEDLAINAGSSLTISTNVNLTMANSSTGNIAGILTINSSRTFDTDNTSVITTVTGSIINAGTVAGATGKLNFASGSTYEHTNTSGTVPTATWDVESTCLITGMTSTLPTGVGGQTLGNLTWNCPNQSNTSTALSGVLTVAGNLTILNTGTYQFRVQSTPITVGKNVYVSGGEMWIAGQATKDMDVNGDFYINGGALDIMGYASTSYSGTLNLKGNFYHTGDQTYSSIGHTGRINFTVNKSSGNVILNSNLTIGSSATLTMTSGNLVTNSNTLTLDASSSISGEGNGHYVVGNLATSQTVASSASSSFGNIGFSIAAGSGDLGVVNVTRVSGTAPAGLGSKINRSWEIIAANSVARDLTFSWNSDDDGSIDRTQTIVYLSSNSGSSWTSVSGSYNLTTDPRSISALSMTLSPSSSLFTVGDASSPLPVELTSFTGSVNGNVVTLNWSTATEVNNYGFEVLRDGTKVGFVKGNGNSNSPKAYSFTDKPSEAKILKYEIKQVDFDGSAKMYGPVEVNVIAPANFVLHQNYPNPYNPTTSIKYEVPFADHVTLKVYNIIGQEVATLFDGIREAGSYTVKFDGSKLSSGIYVYSLKSSSFSKTVKMILMK